MKRFAFLVPTLLLLILLPFGLGTLSNQMGDKVSAESLQMVESAIARAAVECYALEGFYPPELRYLTERYGVAIDEGRYFVDYQFIGSNLMPDITVLPIARGVSENG